MCKMILILIPFQMVIYLVCFDLSAPPEGQREQIFFWLQLLNSSVPNRSKLNTTLEANSATATDNRNWRVMLVGLKSDLMGKPVFTTASLQNWQYQMPNLPLFRDKLFHVSSVAARQSVQELLSSIELVCSMIFSSHSILIPPTFRKLLHSINSCNLLSSDPFIQFQQLHIQLKPEHNMDLDTFELALKYFHTIGQIIFLQNGLVCRSPAIIPKLLAKFVSPFEVRNHLLAEDSDVVQILTQKQIGVILQANTANSTRYKPEMCMCRTGSPALSHIASAISFYV